MCASMDGAWLFCTTETGMLKLFKRGRAPRPNNDKKPRPKGIYALNRSLDWREGLDVAIDPNEHFIVCILNAYQTPGRKPNSKRSSC